MTMRYAEVTRGIFRFRPNRFLARVDIGGTETTVHVKNTGRCRELLLPGAAVYLERSASAGRKTAYDLIAVEKRTERGVLLVNMDAQAPNRVFAEFARRFVPDVRTILPEYRYGKSRLDFCLETPEGRHLVEVKGVTLEEGGHARFPDAPTERGIRHLHELCRAVEEGCRATVFFVIQMEHMTDFSPNDGAHPAFGEALRLAARRGVQIAAYDCRVAPDALTMGKPVKVLL